MPLRPFGLSRLARRLFRRLGGLFLLRVLFIFRSGWRVVLLQPFLYVLPSLFRISVFCLVILW